MSDTPRTDETCRHLEAAAERGEWRQCYADMVLQARILEQQLMLADQHVSRLRKRLEIDPRHPYDGIDCRDETIWQRDVQLAKARERIARLEEVLREAKEGVDMIGCSPEGYDSLCKYRDDLLVQIDNVLAEGGK